MVEKIEEKMVLTDKASKIAGIFRLASAICDGDVDIDADGSGWHIKVVDTARVAMAVIDAEFPQYDCPEPLRFQLDTAKVLKVLSLAKDDIRIVSDGTRVAFEFDWITRVMQVGVGSGNPIRIPDLTYQVTAVLPDADVRKFLSAADYSDIIRITAEGSRITLTAPSDTESCECRIEDADASCDGIHSSVYPAEYVRRVIRAIPCPTMTVQYTASAPCRLSYDAEGVSASVLIAPTVTEEGR